MSARIRCHPFALGAADGELTLHESADETNRGGFSAYATGVRVEGARVVPVRRPDAVLRELGIDHIDVIKIDTEGAEWSIFTAFPPEVLWRVGLIMGELHGVRDFALLDYLQPHFHIGVHKGIRNQASRFFAVNREPGRPAGA